MVEYLIHLDQQIFLWIQHHCHTAFLDTLLPLMRNKETWYPLYILVIIILVYKFRKVGFRMVLVGVFCFLISDLLSSQIAKPLFKRLRPCADPVISQQFTPTIKCGNRGYSFTSSHAANHFAVALGLSLFFYNTKKWLLLTGIMWAGIISLSQVYVGVHYPLDILGGAFIGITVSLSFHILINKYFTKKFMHKINL